MAMLDPLFKNSAGTGIALGIGAALLAPVIISALGGAARPLARAAIKSGLILYEKGRETFAEMAEVVDDLVAEARAEFNHMPQPPSGGDGAAPEPPREAQG